jgi:hypothetical protein
MLEPINHPEKLYDTASLKVAYDALFTHTVIVPADLDTAM